MLKVGGKVVDTHKQPNSIAFLQVADETFDVAIDTRTGVNDNDYQVPFPFNGKIEKLTLQTRAVGPHPRREKPASRAIAKAKD